MEEATRLRDFLLGITPKEWIAKRIKERCAMVACASLGTSIDSDAGATSVRQHTTSYKAAHRDKYHQSSEPSDAQPTITKLWYWVSLCPGLTDFSCMWAAGWTAGSLFIMLLSQGTGVLL